MKIKGSTTVKLYSTENNKLIRKNYFADVIGYLYNRGLIELPDEYWLEDDNGWKSTYHKRYGKIFNDFGKLTNKKYKVEVIQND